jgi:galactonate dehydratase
MDHGPMKITRVLTYLVEGIRYNWTLVKVETDVGIHGWEEAPNWPGSPLVEAACQHIGERLLGCDARQIVRTALKVGMSATDPFRQFGLL